MRSRKAVLLSRHPAKGVCPERVRRGGGVEGSLSCATASLSVCPLALHVVFLRFLEFKTPSSAPPSLFFQSLPDAFALFDRGWGSTVCRKPRCTLCIPRLQGTCKRGWISSLYFQSLAHSSILRILQPLYLPLLRKLPGCIPTLPILEPLHEYLPSHGVPRLDAAVSRGTARCTRSSPQHSNLQLSNIQTFHGTIPCLT